MLIAHGPKIPASKIYVDFINEKRGLAAYSF